MLTVLVAVQLSAQDDFGPEIPIVLEHADSLVGSGSFDAATRTFQGNVRFSQGNVTGRCDRAVHDVARNSVELTGSVMIRQADMTITAPLVRYDGRSSMAVAPRGIRVDQGGRVITSRSGRYDLRQRVASFRQSVHAVDDSVRLWCDSLLHDRTVDTMLAIGNVVIQDSGRRSWFSADRARRDAASGRMDLKGSSKAWSWQDDSSAAPADTLFVTADELSTESSNGSNDRALSATGNVRLVRADAAATSGSLVYRSKDGVIDLAESPVVWSDSSVLTAEAISAVLVSGELRTIDGTGEAVLMTRSDSLIPERFDQIVGNRITISIQPDSMKYLVAAGEAQSVTFRQETGQRKGLAKVVADTIDARIISGQLTDVYWIGGVSGEHHPERLVAGRESDFTLPGFRRPAQRPQYEQIPARKSMLR